MKTAVQLISKRFPIIKAIQEKLGLITQFLKRKLNPLTIHCNDYVADRLGQPTRPLAQSDSQCDKSQNFRHMPVICLKQLL